MQVLRARNVHEALPEGINYLCEKGKRQNSRNGEVLVAPEPVTTVYDRPQERVVFWPERDCNHVFHLMESIWMLFGRNDVAWLEQFNTRMRNFSDDGETFHGAYGYRWRNHFDKDQISVLLHLLHNKPHTRRAVLQMWDADADLDAHEEGLDKPCNTQAYFTCNNGKLDMTVTARSSDIIWGAYGANAVHFSILQEFMAYKLGLGVGRYWQVSNNFHAYVSVLDQYEGLRNHARDPFRERSFNPYRTMEVGVYPLVKDPQTIGRDIRSFVKQEFVYDYTNPFFEEVAEPLRKAYLQWKDKQDENRFTKAYAELDKAASCDWEKAAREWLDRRYEKFKAKQQN